MDQSTWEAHDCSGSEEICYILWNESLIIMVTRCCHYLLPRVTGIHSTPVQFFLRPTLIYRHLCPGLPIGVFLQFFWPIIFMLFLYLPCVLHAPLISFDQLNIWWEQIMMLIMLFSSVLLGPYLFLSTLFSNTLSERQFHTGRIQFCVLHFSLYILK